MYVQEVMIFVVFVRKGVCAEGRDTCRTCEEGVYVQQVVALVVLVRKGCMYSRS